MERESCELCCKVRMVQVITAGSGLDRRCDTQAGELMSSIRLGQLFSTVRIFQCLGAVDILHSPWTAGSESESDASRM